MEIPQEREQLLAELERLQAAYRPVQEQIEQVRVYEDEIGERRKNYAHPTWTLLILGVVAYICFSLYVSITGAQPAILGWLYNLVPWWGALIGLLVPVIIIRLYLWRRNQRKIIDLERLCVERSGIIGEMTAMIERDFIPAAYKQYYIIMYLHSVIVSGRADSFEDAVAEFERDMQHERLQLRINQTERGISDARLDAEAARHAADKAYKEAKAARKRDARANGTIVQKIGSYF